LKTNIPGGSFNIPKDLLDEVKKVKKKSEDNVNDIEETVKNLDAEKVDVEDIEVDEEKERQQKIDEALEAIKEKLNIELTDDELYDLCTKNQMTKRNIKIFGGKIYATFKYGLTVDELQYVDKKMKQADESGQFTAVGLKSLYTRLLLSHVLLELGKPDNIKPVGSDPENRFKEIGLMNSLLVEELTRKWNMFLFLVDETLKKEDTLKK
jgi:Asp-tRNA(Asn)/Glu-tRNA(Gln) amidotransferase A subunit family amidase